jgi:hypothetical protein
MSDTHIEQPRDERGQFTETEPETGRAAELHRAGYKTLQEHEEQAPKEYRSDREGLREAARDFDSRQADLPFEVDVDAARPEQLPPDVALDLKQAAERDSKHRFAEDIVEKLNEFKRESEAVQRDLGIPEEDHDQHWNAWLQGQMAAAQGQPVQEQPVQEAPADPARAAQTKWEATWNAMSAEEQAAYRANYDAQQQRIAQQAAALEQQQKQYAEGLQHLHAAATMEAQQAMRAAGLRSVADYHDLAVRDPQKFQQVQAAIAKQNQVARAASEYVQQQAQHQAQQQRAVLDQAYARATAQIISEEPELAQPGKLAEAQQQIATFLIENNLDPRAVASNPAIIADANAQRFLLKQARAHHAAKALKNVQREAARPKTPAMRPGVQTPPPNRTADRDQALQKQLARATGNRAVKIASEMHLLRTGGH